MAAIVMLSWGKMVGAVVGLVVRSPVRGIIQRPVCVHLCPHTMMRPWYTMVQPILVKVMVHLALHIVTTDSNECKARLGMICAAWALDCRASMLRVQVCVDSTLAPFGRPATRGTMAGRTFVVGALVVRKLLMAQESSIAHCLMVLASVLIIFNKTEAAKA